MKTVSRKLIVIAGPTAVGKTGVSIHLAKNFNTEIVSADSRQIFKELTIGTAKPSVIELQDVKHHLINSHSITQDYDAAQFGRDALKIIHQIFKNHDLAIICGGSGLYIKAVCEGFDEIPEVSGGIREQLIAQYTSNGLSWLQQQMTDLDPAYYETLDHKNPHRLIRALEIKLGTGKSISSFRSNTKLQHDFSILKIGLELPRDVLYKQIDERVDKMIAQGLFQEAEQLYPFKDRNALQTVGYQEIFDFMDGKFDRNEAIRMLKRNSRRYAKRQLTWFKRDSEFHWFQPDQFDDIFTCIGTNA